MKTLSLERMQKISGGNRDLDCLNMELAFASALWEANDAYNNNQTAKGDLYTAIAAGDGAWLSQNCYY